MERWVGKVAVVTGASSGIGAQILIDLVNAGVKTVGIARRVDRVEALKSKVKPEFQSNLFAQKGDVTDEASIKSVFAWIEENLGGVYILINNAGCQRTTNIVDPDNTQALKEVIDTNVFGTVYAVREAFQTMQKGNANGHIILLNSIVGHKVPYLVGTFPSLNLYASAKHAITALTEVLRQEFISFGTKIKITVSPCGVLASIAF